MKAESEKLATSLGLSMHILAASIVMIGVSSTLIGLIKVAKAQLPASRAATMIFLVSAVTSYLSPQGSR